MKKLIGLILALALCVCGVMPAMAEEATRTVTDTIGNEITVPAEISRIAIISTMPLASVFCMVEESGEKLVGLTPASKNAAMNSFVRRIAPEIENISTAFAEGESVNVEEVVKLNPDVVFYNTNNAADVSAVEQLTALGIPCVLWDNNYFDDGDEWFGLFDRTALRCNSPEVLKAMLPFRAAKK